MQQHMPAWKRIGLKLKYAKDPYDPPLQQYQDAESEITGASNGDHDGYETPSLDQVRPPKKRKWSPKPTARLRMDVATPSQGRSLREQSKETNIDTARCDDSSADGTKRVETGGDRQTSKGEITEPSLKSRRKSVTFTPETKQDDGLSASSAFTSGVEASSRANDCAKPTAGTNHEGGIPNRSASGSSRTNTYRNDSSFAQGEEPPKSITSKGPGNNTPSWLEYLQQYSADRQSWRFNKNKQTGLLKNLFDTHLIPSEYNQAIVEYVTGLQGQAAQHRLIESAISVLRPIADRQLKVDLDSMESEQARREAYATALKRHIQQYEQSKIDNSSEYDEQQLAEMKDEIERGQRAEAVLAELLQKELHPERYPQANAAEQRQHQQQRTGTSVPNGDRKREASASTASPRIPELQKKKKRKVRTAYADESSDSSSDSDIEILKGPTTIREALRPVSGSPARGAKPKPEHIIFDDDLLDKKFPKDKSYHELAPKRKRDDKKTRGFAYTHGTKDDEWE